MKIILNQTNSVIGDIKGNKEKIISGYKDALKDGAELVIFPELALCGYPPLDLVEKKEFRDLVNEVANEIASMTSSVGLIFGSITEDYEDIIGTGVYNSALLCFDGKIQFIQNKTLLPNYDVFDEVRYFEPAKSVSVFEYKGTKLGISICEDIWNDADYWKKRRYPLDPIQSLIDQDAELLINISASPYAYGKRMERFEMLSTLAKIDNVTLVYCCCAGAQTDLIFDGASMCFDNKGDLLRLGKSFSEDTIIFDTEKKYEPIAAIEKSFSEEVLSALIFGLRDYALKTGFKKALIGLSGGIDSALVTYIAVEAFGKDNVHVVMMPSKYSSDGSITDSEMLIKNLEISSDLVSVQPVFDSILNRLEEPFEGTNQDVTEENIQSRIRGIYLMAFSNKFGYLLCTTGNKSEIAVGYATLYGDMAGALAIIGDIYKTQVYEICNFINKKKEIIPQNIIDKAPSAELRPDQKDQDSLPPYEQLDRVLKMYLEEQKELKEIIEIEKDEEMVKKTLRLIDLNEFKRKQGAPVLRVSTKAFGYGRRFPIVNGWRKNL
ncbi:MAG: NAD+ synthase [Melioribacteraceae bacterium]|nr:NAD+ synthase [Melioribacteraceae bacterium]